MSASNRPIEKIIQDDITIWLFKRYPSPRPYQVMISNNHNDDAPVITYYETKDEAYNILAEYVSNDVMEAC